MKFSLEIDMDGAAFEDNPYELSDILDLSPMPPYSISSGKLRDSNGNTVGEWRIEE